MNKRQKEGEVGNTGSEHESVCSVCKNEDATVITPKLRQMTDRHGEQSENGEGE